MWALFLPILSLALIPLVSLSLLFSDDMNNKNVVATSEVTQFVEYSFSVGKKMTLSPKDNDPWANDVLPLPPEWFCRTNCPWANRRDENTGYRYAYGVPVEKRNSTTGFVQATQGSPSFGIKRNGKFEGGLALGGLVPPDWIPEGAFVFAVKQRPYIR